MSSIKGLLGGIVADILINNAGINLGMASLSDTTVAMFDKMISVNLRGPWYLSSRIAPKWVILEADV